MEIIEFSSLPESIKYYLGEQEYTPNFQAKFDDGTYVLHGKETNGCYMLVLKIIGKELWQLAATSLNAQFFSYLSERIHLELDHEGTIDIEKRSKE